MRLNKMYSRVAADTTEGRFGMSWGINALGPEYVDLW